MKLAAILETFCTSRFKCEVAKTNDWLRAAFPRHVAPRADWRHNAVNPHPMHRPSALFTDASPSSPPLKRTSRSRAQAATSLLTGTAMNAPAHRPRAGRTIIGTRALSQLTTIYLDNDAPTPSPRFLCFLSHCVTERFAYSRHFDTEPVSAFINLSSITVDLPTASTLHSDRPT